MEGSPDIDRISSLPDDILTRILSSVSSKEAVQTCVLSKRWRNTWASVPVLNFHSGDHSWFGYPDDDDDDDDSEDFTDGDIWFDRFVNKLLENRGPSKLDTVIYKWDFGLGSCEPSMGWLDCAVQLMPRVINFHISGVQRIKFPDSVFSCVSLENLDLDLSSREVPNFTPKSIVLPSLKILVLSAVWVKDDFTKMLFLGCPSLETLKLKNCELFISEISSNVLKELALYKCGQAQHMRISCPGLASFSIFSTWCTGKGVSLEHMPSLVNADIVLYGITRNLVTSDLPNLNLLSCLSNVTILELHFDCFPEVKGRWEKDIGNCSTFRNLKSLIIRNWHIDNDFDFISRFLKHSPVLRQLTIHLMIHLGYYEVEEPKPDTSFQLEYLETVDIHCLLLTRCATTLISVLGRQVKTIGNINITTEKILLDI